jgi:hypothetical protein
MWAAGDSCRYGLNKLLHQAADPHRPLIMPVILEI